MWAEKGKIVYKNPVYQKTEFIPCRKKEPLSLAIDSLIIFTNLFERISLGISIFFVFFALCVLGYTVYIYFGGIKPVEGWAPIMGVLSVSFLDFCFNDCRTKIFINYIKNGIYASKLFNRVYRKTRNGIKGGLDENISRLYGICRKQSGTE